MFICLDCGSVFDEPEYFYDFHGMETPPYEIYKGCPGCGGAYTDAITCSICGEYILDEYADVVDGQNICENCYTRRTIGE